MLLFWLFALSIYSGYWLIDSLITVIAKFLILKFGGVKVDERYALPVAVGYMLGTGFGGFLMLTALALSYDHQRLTKIYLSCFLSPFSPPTTNTFFPFRSYLERLAGGSKFFWLPAQS